MINGGETNVASYEFKNGSFEVIVTWACGGSGHGGF